MLDNTNIDYFLKLESPEYYTNCLPITKDIQDLVLKTREEIEQIKLGKRIRDIIYLKKYKAFVLALEDKDGFLGVIKNFDNY